MMPRIVIVEPLSSFSVADKIWGQRSIGSPVGSLIVDKNNK